MVTQFQGCNNTVIFNFFKLSLFIFFSLFFLFGSSSAREGLEINPLVEFFSREELEQIAGYGTQKLSTVLVSGTVLCGSRLDGITQKLPPLPISGALVAISCHTSGKMRKSNWARGKTDENGEFLIDLPSHLHAIPNLEKACLVKVVHLPKNSPCLPTFTHNHKGLELLRTRNGIRSYTAQTILLTPKKHHKGAKIHKA